MSVVYVYSISCESDHPVVRQRRKRLGISSGNHLALEVVYVMRVLVPGAEKFPDRPKLNALSANGLLLHLLARTLPALGSVATTVAAR